MAFRDVRRQHKLVFRFDPELDLIEVMHCGRLETVRLADYRPRSRHQARADASVNFRRIEGIDESQPVCYPD